VEAITRRVKATRLMVPLGVACPTVSARQMRRAPASMAVLNSVSSVSGALRVVSSVTKVTSRPCLTVNSTASRVRRTNRSRSHSSTYRRMGLEPRKVSTSTLRPVFSTMSTIGSMSETSVRAAQVGSMGSRSRTISLTRSSTSM